MLKCSASNPFYSRLPVAQAEVNFHDFGPAQPQYHHKNNHEDLQHVQHIQPYHHVSHKPALFGEQVVIHAAHKPKIPEWIDWHDYSRLENESKREGPGEQGNAVKLEQQERAESAYKGNLPRPYRY